MADTRLLVTGDIPHFTDGGPGGAPCDAAELIAMEAGISWDNVVHVEQGDQRGLNRLQTMPQYVASVSLKDVEQALPSATELVVFNTHPNRFIGRHRARQVGAVLLLASQQRVSFRYFIHDEQFRQDYLDKLAAAKLTQ